MSVCKPNHVSGLLLQAYSLCSADCSVCLLIFNFKTDYCLCLHLNMLFWRLDVTCINAWYLHSSITPTSPLLLVANHTMPPWHRSCPGGSACHHVWWKPGHFQGGLEVYQGINQSVQGGDICTDDHSIFALVRVSWRVIRHLPFPQRVVDKRPSFWCQNFTVKMALLFWFPPPQVVPTAQFFKLVIFCLTSFTDVLIWLTKLRIFSALTADGNTGLLL